MGVEFNCGINIHHTVCGWCKL